MPATHIPRRIGRYEILDRIGFGGMGMVFRGRDPHIGRSVAIKLLRVGDEDLHDRFLREAQSAGSLKHPNIVTIYDFGDHDGSPFIVMEYVEGTTLAEYIKQNIPLTIARKLELLAELAAGLEYAHNKGVVHRDVKPANVMVDREGILRILDFGIARVTDSGLTQTGMIMGTPNYMSPEQVEGKPSDRRSDIFAAGLVMYELLSYRQAFPGDTMHQVMNAIVRQTPVPLRTLVPDLDPALEHIVNRAIEKDPARRYQTMAAMGTQLARVRSKLGPAEPVALDEGTVMRDGGAIPARTDRHVIEQRRAERIQTLLKSAQRALDTGRFVEALDACEQVVLINPEDAAAAALMEQARAALDQQQVQQLVGEAGGYLGEGDVAAATELVRRALGINPHSPEANALLEHITALERRERERIARERAIGLAIDTCRDAALAGDVEGVIAAAEEVLALDPGHAEARELMTEARGLIEAREQEREAERRAREAVERARRAFQEGRHGESIDQLEQYSPPHAIVLRALEELRTERAEFERLKREAERQRQREAEQAAAEKQLQIAVALSRAAVALSEQRFADATAAADAALALDPGHPRGVQLRDEIGTAIEARQRHEEIERQAEEGVRTAEALFDAGDHAAAIDLLTRLPGDLPRVNTALARLQQRQRATGEREIEARRAEHERRAAEALEHARARVAAGEPAEALEELEQFAPPHPDVDRMLRDLRRDRERRREAQLVAEQTAAAAGEIESGRFEDAVSRLTRLPQSSRGLNEVAALLARAEAGAAAAREAQRERHSAVSQLTDAETAANGWEPARTLAILETLDKRVKARTDLDDLKPRIAQLAAFARKRQDVLRLLQESTAQLRSGAVQGALATIDRALGEEPQLPGAAELRGRIESAIAAETEAQQREDAARAAVSAARKLAAEGHLADAIALLEQADTSHAVVAPALADLRRERSDGERHDREQREQDEKRVQARKVEIASLLKRARKAKTPDAAIALLRSALELDPENPEAQEALGKYQEKRRELTQERDGATVPAGGGARWRLVATALGVLTFGLLSYNLWNREDPQPPPVSTTVPVTTTAAATPVAPPATVPPPQPPPDTGIVATTTPPREGQRAGRGTIPGSSTGTGQRPTLPIAQTPPPNVQVTSVPTTSIPTTTTVTTTTVPPTTTVPAPAPSISDAAARQLLRSYYDAYKSMSFDALREVFPAATPAHRTRLEALRKNYESCEYQMGQVDMTPVSDSRAFATAEVTEVCRPRIRAPNQTITASRTFTFGKSPDGRWIVTNGPF